MKCFGSDAHMTLFYNRELTQMKPMKLDKSLQNSTIETFTRQSDTPCTTSGRSFLVSSSPVTWERLGPAASVTKENTVRHLGVLKTSRIDADRKKWICCATAT